MRRQQTGIGHAALSTCSTQEASLSLSVFGLRVFLLLASLPALAQPGISMATVAVCPAPQLASVEPTGQVATLIAQLSEESPDRRHVAAQALLEMGPAVEPQVRWAWQHATPAPTSSSPAPPAGPPRPAPLELEVLLSRLAEQRHMQPSLITLHYRDAPLTNILGDLGRQTECAVRVGTFFGPADSVSAARLNVNLDHATFWDTMRTLGQSTDLLPLEPPGDGGTLFFMHYSTPTLPAGARTTNASTRLGPSAIRAARPAVAGPIQITPSSLELTHTTDYASGQKTAHFTLILRAEAEPKLSDAGTHARVRLDECVDDHGQSLLLADQRTFHSTDEASSWHWTVGVLYNPDPTLWHWTVPVQLAAPGRGHRIRRLKGQFQVSLCLPQRYLGFPDVLHAQGQSREFADLEVAIREVKTQFGGGAWIAVEESAPAESPLAFSFTHPRKFAIPYGPDLGPIMADLFFLPDLGFRMASGRFARIFGIDITASPHDPSSLDQRVRQESGRTVLARGFSFSKDALPASLEWRTPTEVRWLSLPFELRDLPVP